jgi:acyl carrier protein
MPNSIEQQVLALFRRQLWYRPSLTITPADRLIDDLGLDSLDFVELTVRLEYHFCLHIVDAELDEWNTIADVIACVAHHRAVRELLAAP